MWSLTKFNGDTIEWYSSKEYKDVEQNLDEAKKVLYNIEQILKDKGISDEGAILLIQKELFLFGVKNKNCLRLKE